MWACNTAAANGGSGSEQALRHASLIGSVPDAAQAASGTVAATPVFGFTSAAAFASNNMNEAGRSEAEGSAALGAPAVSAAAASGTDCTSGCLQQQASDKQAVAREKSRAAARRFRERERAKRVEAQAAADSMAEELAALRLENERLAYAAGLMEKTLEFRQAVLALVQSLQVAPHVLPSPGSAALAPHGSGEAAVAAASQRLVAVAHRMPPQEEMERFAAQLPGGSSGGCGTSGGGASAGSGALGGSTGGRQPAEPAAAPAWPDSAAFCEGGGDSGGLEWTLTPGDRLAGNSTARAGAMEVVPAAPARQLQPPAVPGDGWGVAGVPLAIGGCGGGSTAVFAQVITAATAACGADSGVGGLLHQEGAPPPDNAALCQRIEHVNNLEAVQRLAGRHLGRLREAWAAVATAQFAPGCPARAAMEGELSGLAQLFWHLAQLKPCLMHAYMIATLPPANLDLSAHWENVAVDSLPLLSEGEIAHLRAAYQRYARRMAVAAVGVRPFVDRLQALAAAASAASAPSLACVSQQHAEVAELASRLQSGIQQQYLASMGLLSDTTRHANLLVRCFWHVSGGQYTPDHPSIIAAVLREHRRQMQRLAAAAGSSGSPLASQS